VVSNVIAWGAKVDCAGIGGLRQGNALGWFCALQESLTAPEFQLRIAGGAPAR
jgi:hypothetical protein